MDIIINVFEYMFIYMIFLDFEVYLKLCIFVNFWVRIFWVVEMRFRVFINFWVDSSNCIVGCVWWIVVINFSCNVLYWYILIINLLIKLLNICLIINVNFF